MRTILGIFISGSLMAFSGCATIFSGTKDNVSISSTPSGAMVKINGQEYGRTPTTFPLKRQGTPPMIEVSEKGYEKKFFAPDNSFNGVAILNTICPLCWVIDAVTGAMWNYDRTAYSVELEPESLK